MKILLITQQKLTGLNYHRQFIPHKHLLNNYDNYVIAKRYSLNDISDQELAKCDIVSFLRIPDDTGQGNSLNMIKRAKSFGCKTVIDIDDYWNLRDSHELKPIYDIQNYPKQAVESLKAVDWVTTTTEHFADKIKEFNKNVTVIPNSIDQTEVQYTVEEKKSDRVRFGWIGGVFHTEDLKLIQQGFNDTWKNVRNDKFQFCLGGWNYPNKLEYVKGILKDKRITSDVRKTFNDLERWMLSGVDVPDSAIFHKKYGNVQQFDVIEGYMTGELKHIKNKEYREYLEKREGTEGESHPYRRLPSKGAHEYCQMYNEIDVALVPLVENDFNSCKSQIKIIEAGWFKKAVVVSNTLPYTLDCNKYNSVLIGKESWSMAIKSMIHNKNRREDLAEELHEHVLDNYMMDDVNKIRNQLYQSL